MKKYLIFIFILTIMTINTVKGERTTNYIEAWSVNEQIAYNEENYVYAMMLSHKSIAYKNGFVVSSVDFEKFEKTSEGETTILIYDEKGKVSKETTIKNATVLEFATINDYIYALQYYMDDSFTIAKYDENLNKMDEIETDYNLEFTYITTMYNIKTFASFENKLYIITSEGDAATEYDENLKELRTISAYTEEEMLCKIGREYCYYVNGDGNTEGNFVFIGYDIKDNFEIHTGAHSGSIGIIKIVKKGKEKQTITFDMAPLMFSPRIINNNIVSLVTDSSSSSGVAILDMNGNRVQYIANKKTSFHYLSVNKNTNTFIVTTVEIKENCNNTNSSCQIIKHTTYKEGKEIIQSQHPSNEIFGELIKTSDNGYISIGTTDLKDIEGITINGYVDGIIAKYDSEGKITWLKNSGRSGYDFFEDVIEVQDGYVVVGNDGSDAFIVKFDKNGNVLWQKSWGGNNSDYFYGVAYVNENYVAVGSTTSTDIEGISQSNYKVGVIIKYDKDGNFISQTQYNCDQNSEFHDILTLSTDEYIVLGYEFGSILSEVMIKFDENSNEEWKLKSDNNYNYEYYDMNMIILNDGSYVVSGIQRMAPGEYTNKIMKINPEREVVLEYTAGYLNDKDSINSITETSDGGFIVGVNGFNECLDTNCVTSPAYITKISSNNEVEWMVPYLAEYDNYETRIVQVIEKSNNEFIVVGGVEYIDEVGEKNLETYYTKIAPNFIIDQEETTNGTYEVTNEDGKGVITLNPEKGYTLNTLTITNAKGEQVEYYEKDGKYYFDLTEAVTVNVTYKEEVINPNTITFLKLGFIAVIVFVIYNLFISKKLKINRYA